jgi:hypothetical protein
MISGGRHCPSWPVSGFVSAKLRYLTAMDHVEHVLIVGTSIPIRIAWRIRGEVKVFTTSSQVSKYMAAVRKNRRLNLEQPVVHRPVKPF